MPVRDEILTANRRFSQAFDPGSFAILPARKFAVVTCMDARLDPARFLGLRVGDAHVVRNAGGIVTADALRSLVISHHLLGTEEALVIAHTDCAMTKFSNDELRGRLGGEADDVDFLPFPDPAARVRASLRTIEESPLLPESYRAAGFVYDVVSGELSPVA
ncbi:MAG: beta-class carbonic anhydrase [Gaiellaceae bacterium]